MTSVPAHRVVITGLGLITPLGIGVEATWEGLTAGRSGVGPITKFDAAAHDTRIAAEVKDFNPLDFMDKKDAKRMQPFIAYAIAAARMAVEDSGLIINDDNAPDVGVITGCGLGGLSLLEETNRIMAIKGPSRVTPFFIPTMIGNMAAGMVSIILGAKGPNSSLATACAAGAHAVGDSFKIVQSGRAKAMITGGVESVVTPSCVAGFNALKALSTRNDDPQGASRPFDQDRDGFVVGEGSGMMVLETLESARARGAKIYAEMAGYGMSGDGFHMTAPPPDGDGAVRCMRAALKDAGMEPSAIDYINAHGTSTPLNDLYESRAIKTVFGDHAYKLAVSSTKSMTGHLLGGAGGIESCFSALAVHTGTLPPTINMKTPGEECDLDYVPNESRKADPEVIMSNSFGFGGTNAVLMMKKVSD